MRKLSLFILSVIFAGVLQGCNGEEADKKNPRREVNIIADADDIKFVVAADDFFRSEIELGKLAIKQGGDKRIKNFGAMMMRDYTKIDAKLVALSLTKKIDLPDSLDAVAGNGVDSVAKKTGKEFDEAYINYIIAGHKQAIVFFTDAGKHRFDVDVKKFAAKSALSLKRHLEAIDAINDSRK